MLKSLRIRYVLPASYLLVAVMAGSFLILSWYVGSEIRHSVDDLARHDVAKQRAAAELSTAVGGITNSLVAVMTHTRHPAAGRSDAESAFDAIQEQLSRLRTLVREHPHGTTSSKYARIDEGLSKAMLLRSEILVALEKAGEPGYDLHPPLRRWAERTNSVDTDLSHLQDEVSEHSLDVAKHAVWWVELNLSLVFVALVLSVFGGIAGTIFVVRYIAQPLDWGARILRKLASGRRDLVIDVPDRKDEIGALFSAFADYQDSLRRGEALAFEANQHRGRLDAALNNMSHGLAMFDGQGCLILRN